ncbi:immunity 63 family protein [Raoultella terrigena]|uniref:Imm63 family immunity protein n=1 Tax=Raoultella terrigena TaxID=577 RepID=UPI002DB6E847|nr:Imm63 family immunity protein [Raoultella terrigena]MEB8194985.1 immunity 63 family protein [Raoultella terrigena]
MLHSINEIQKIVFDLGSKICIPAEKLHVFEISPEDGRPHISFDNNEYNYIHEERGVEFSRKTTDDLDTLLYWIISDLVFNMAFQYELKHRIEHVDGRRITFPKVVKLMGELHPSWGFKVQEEINEILSRNPYKDM